MEHTASMMWPLAAPARADRPSQLLNEIMPLIYKRFTDKSAEEWRQIYKVLYLPSYHLQSSG